MPWSTSTDVAGGVEADLMLTLTLTLMLMPMPMWSPSDPVLAACWTRGAA